MPDYSINKKKRLQRLFLLLVLAGMAFISVVSSQNLLPTSERWAQFNKVVDLRTLQEGKVVSLRIGDRLILLLKPNQVQMNAVHALNEHVWNKSFQRYNGVFVFIGHSTGKKGKCALAHKPPRPSRLLDHDPDTLWLGGYWDVACESSYDYAGRAIKSHNRSFNGFNPEVANLATPHVKILDENHIRIHPNKSWFLSPTEF